MKTVNLRKTPNGLLVDDYECVAKNFQTERGFLINLIQQKDQNQGRLDPFNTAHIDFYFWSDMQHISSLGKRLLYHKDSKGYYNCLSFDIKWDTPINQDPDSVHDYYSWQTPNSYIVQRAGDEEIIYGKVKDFSVVHYAVISNLVQKIRYAISSLTMQYCVNAYSQLLTSSVGKPIEEQVTITDFELNRPDHLLKQA